MNWYRLKNRLLSRLLVRFPALAKRFVDAYAPRESTDIPWTPFKLPLSRCTVALVTTAGVHHRDESGFDMADREGDPTYRLIDATRPFDSLMITHDYYDHADADRDLNIVFPIERLREFAAEGIIGSVAERNFSFMGHITGRHIPTLVNTTAPEVAQLLKRDQVDAVVLTPG